MFFPRVRRQVRSSPKVSVRTSRDPAVHHSHHLPCAAFLPHHNSRSLGDACANADDSTRSLSVDEFDSKDYRVGVSTSIEPQAGPPTWKSPFHHVASFAADASGAFGSEPPIFPA